MALAKSGGSPEETPRYFVPEAAQYLRMSEATLASWVSGRSYDVAAGKKWWQGLIQRPDRDDARMSFQNLIEAYVLSSLRKQYRVKMPAVREALEFAGKKLGIERLLLSDQLRVTTGNVFLEHVGKLINVGLGGQEAMPEILAKYLDRIEWSGGFGSRLYPITRNDPADSPREVFIDPSIAFGRPVLRHGAIRTATINDRFQAGESFEVLSNDYGLAISEVEEALRYERALPLAA
jgi:uncharacterized protein (DUF433 family)